MLGSLKLMTKVAGWSPRGAGAPMGGKLLGRVGGVLWLGWLDSDHSGSSSVLAAISSEEEDRQGS